MNYQETLDWLFSQLPMYQRQGKAAYKADLSNTHALMHLLNHPESSFKSIHIAGTNGKGSVSHMIASVCQEAGLQTGLYTSPHLKDFRERIRINGAMIPEEHVTDFVQAHRDAFTAIGLSFFEWTVGLAFDYFRKEKVDIVVLETGMGGRLDSTNVVTPEVSVITNIGLDHTAFLGNTLEAIAGEKAGIIKPEIPVVIGRKQPETENVFHNKAADLEAPIVFAEDVVSDPSFPTDLMGSYQVENSRTAQIALEKLADVFPSINKATIQAGLKKVVSNTGLLGRWQVVNMAPQVILDTAHNRDGLSHTMKQLKATPHHRLHIVFGAVNDKAISELTELLPKDARYYLCEPEIPRAMKLADLKAIFEGANLNHAVFPSVREAYNTALKLAEEIDLIYVGGSTFVVAEAL